MGVQNEDCGGLRRIREGNESRGGFWGVLNDAESVRKDVVRLRKVQASD